MKFCKHDWLVYHQLSIQLFKLYFRNMPHCDNCKGVWSLKSFESFEKIIFQVMKIYIKRFCKRLLYWKEQHVLVSCFISASIQIHPSAITHVKQAYLHLWILQICLLLNISHAQVNSWGCYRDLRLNICPSMF